MIMKTRHILFGLASAAMMTIAGCETAEIKDVQSPEANASSFELIADITQTKTTLDPQDGYKVAWEEDDIIYMVTSDGTWGAPYVDEDNTNIKTIAEFTYADGKFSTEATIADGEYTFKGMYAAASQKSYHRGASSTHKLQATQTQDCADPTAHIKDNDALVGTFTATVPMSETAKMNMSHLYTLMQVDVKNTTGEAIEVTKFEMTAEGADLAGVFNVVAFDTPAISTKSGASSTITVNITGGDVENNASLPVYFVMAPFADYSGDVTFKVTDSNENTYTKTVAMNGISFEAGKYNTTSYAISVADEVEPEPANVTWDLTDDSYSSESQNEVVWSSEVVNMTLEKKNSSTNANNYLGGTNAHTRVYKGHILSFKPLGGCTISKIEIVATSEDYATNWVNSTWTNGDASNSSADVTVIPTDGKETVSVDITVATRAKSITVYYELGEGGETPEPGNKTLVSIAVENPKTEYTVGDTFVEPTVKATYDDASTATVTGATFTGNDLTSEGTKTVTVSYTEGDVTATTTFGITVSAPKVLIEDGTYVIAVKEDNTYYAVSTDANGSRRDFVELPGYSSGGIGTTDSKIVWTIKNTGAGIKIYSGEQYWKAGKNGISLVSSSNATIISVSKSGSEGAYLLSGDCGSDGIRYLSKNEDYGFGFYAESNKENIYLIPATFVGLPNFDVPVVTAELNDDKTGIDVSWNAVENATSYVVSCTGQETVTVTGTSYSFIDLAAGAYIITVLAKTENYSAISQPVEIYVPVIDSEEQEQVATYQHVFKSKPSIGPVKLSDVSWTLSATNLGSYNSNNYAGVQFGTSKKSGEIKLTSESPFTYDSKSSIKEVRLWLNTGGATVNSTVTIGGVECSKDGTIVKNTAAGTDYTKASLVTFTPNGVTSGEVVINLTCENAGYFCAIEIDVY